MTRVHPLIRPRRLRLCAWALLLGVCAALMAEDALARPGGGNAFSSPSEPDDSPSSGSSDDSSGSSDHSSSGSSLFDRDDDAKDSPSSHESSAPTGPPAIQYCAKHALDRPENMRVRIAGKSSAYGTAPPRVGPPKVTNPHSLFPGILVLCIPLGGLLFVLVGGTWEALQGRKWPGWTTRKRPAPSRDKSQAPKPPLASARHLLSGLRVQDQDFSTGLLEDFAYSLIAEAHTARGAGKLARLQPYLSEAATAALHGLGVGKAVSAFVIGAMRYTAIERDGVVVSKYTIQRVVRVEFEIEACYTETSAQGDAQSYYTLERWVFMRDKSAKSRPPERIRTLDCPACGAPLDRMLSCTCGYCGKNVASGAFDWVIESITTVQRNPRPPMLTGTTEERGTNRSTVFDSELATRRAALAVRDPAFDEAVLGERVRLIFGVMQRAWSSLAWEGARPYLTDNLFQTNAYWMAAYRAQGLRNVTNDARITGIELVRVDTDKWFDSVTVRIHATGFDFTLRDSDDRVVGGSQTELRPYSEYWTLIRSVSRQGTVTVEPVCPSCGGPIVVSMTARCEHCSAKVNSGEFDWVLSRIEQDEAYQS